MLKGTLRMVERRLEDQDTFDGLFDALILVQEDLIDVLNATEAMATRERGSRGKIGQMTSRRSAPKRTRKASAWNTFVKTEMPKVLKAHPRFTPQRAMKEVSKRWRSSPKNPNRGRRKR